MVDDDRSFLGVVGSNEATLHGLWKNELSLFCHLVVKSKDCVLPLTWRNLEVTWTMISEHLFCCTPILGNLKGILFAMCRIVEVSPLMVGVMASQVVYFFNDPWDHDILFLQISRYLHLFQLITFASHFWVSSFEKAYPPN